MSVDVYSYFTKIEMHAFEYNLHVYRKESRKKKTIGLVITRKLRNQSATRRHSNFKYCDVFAVECLAIAPQK